MVMILNCMLHLTLSTYKYFVLINLNFDVQHCLPSKSIKILKSISINDHAKYDILRNTWLDTATKKVKKWQHKRWQIILK